MKRIEDHQDLLNLYYWSQQSLIAEYSGSIDKDNEKLDEQVKEYAERNGLEVPDGLRI